MSGEGRLKSGDREKREEDSPSFQENITVALSTQRTRTTSGEEDIGED